MSCSAYDHHRSQLFKASFLWSACISMGGFLTFSTVLLSLNLTASHFKHYHQPRLQRPITRILMMVPLYSVCSWLSLVWSEYSVYINVIRDCYEAFVVYNFFVLFMEYLGADAAARKLVLSMKGPRRLPPPMCCLHHRPNYRHFLSFCSIGILQYVVVRVSTTVASVAMELNHVYCPESMDPRFGHFYTTVINAVSVGTAMFTLFSLYLPIRSDIAEFNPVLQFLSIKFIIFFQFWMGIIIKVTSSAEMASNQGTPPWSQADVSLLVQNFATIIEMLLASILHFWAFDVTIFTIRNAPTTSIWDGVKDSFYWLDLYHDFIFALSFLHRRVLVCCISQFTYVPLSANSSAENINSSEQIT